MSNSEIFLVRHGEDEGSELTELGRMQAGRAASTLQGIIRDPSDAVLITSNRLRAGQTMEIIAEALNKDFVISKLVGDVGNCPEVMIGYANKLTDFLALCLNEAGVEYEPQNPLVVVTHAPMIAAAQNSSALDIRNGHVSRYDGHTWAPSQF